MFEKKYIIIIAIVVCLFILYYFYDELVNIKKMYIPTYQKTMALEERLDKLEKKQLIFNRKESVKDIDSTALTITYQSDMAKNGNLSAKYVELSESESKQLLNNIAQSKTKQNTGRIPIGDISDPKPVSTKPVKKNILEFENSDKPDIAISRLNESLDSETINVPVAGLIKKNSIIHSDMAAGEFEKIYESLNAKGVLSTDANDGFDDDIVRDISESIQYADMPSENSVSDIPAKTNKSIKNIKSRRGKKTSVKQS